MTTQKLKEKISKLADDIGEHCDSVCIFATLQDRGGITKSLNATRGNHYANMGQVREWMITEEQHQKNYAARIELEEDGE